MDIQHRLGVRQRRRVIVGGVDRIVVVVGCVDAVVGIVVDAVVMNSSASVEIREGGAFGEITEIEVMAEAGNTRIYRIDLLINSVFNPTNLEFKLYPNPFSDILHLEFSGNTTPSRIEMINITGSVVRIFENITSNTITLQCGDLPSGIYFINVSCNCGNQITQKFVIR